MAVRKILQVGEPSLLERSQEVENISCLHSVTVIEDLIETLEEAQGVGIAAPQIGENVRIFITEIPVTPTRLPEHADSLRVYINPEIIEFSNESIEIYESCLSIAFAEFFLPILRPKTITVEAYDLQGRKFRLKCNGLLARAIQHEYDHLNGVLFIEKTKDLKRAISGEHNQALNKSSKEVFEARKITLKELIYL